VGKGDRIDVLGEGDVLAFANACRYLAGVTAVEKHDRVVSVRVPNGPAAIASVVGAAERTGLAIKDIGVLQPDLEDVFLNLTGKALRD
jgi:hypothetical protein